jgi:hypothetical protein
VSGCVEGGMGDREVPQIGILSVRADLRGARAEASPREEGGSRGKHGFPRATQPKAEEAAA